MPARRGYDYLDWVAGVEHHTLVEAHTAVFPVVRVTTPYKRQPLVHHSQTALRGSFAGDGLRAGLLASVATDRAASDRHEHRRGTAGCDRGQASADRADASADASAVFLHYSNLAVDPQLLDGGLENHRSILTGWRWRDDRRRPELRKRIAVRIRAVGTTAQNTDHTQNQILTELHGSPRSAFQEHPVLVFSGY